MKECFLILSVDEEENLYLSSRDIEQQTFTIVDLDEKCKHDVQLVVKAKKFETESQPLNFEYGTFRK